MPDAELDEWAKRFDIIWLMGVWQPSVEGRKGALGHRALAEEFRKALPDVKSADVVSSPYAVMDYRVSEELGGGAALAKFRRKLHARGLRLMLDLVPNHMALDHPWVEKYPEWFVQGTAEDRAREPQNYFRAKTRRGAKIFAHGRDPYFDGWSDTVQIHIFSAAMRSAMVKLVLELADLCDALRCDMAMLLLNDIFKKTWGEKAGEMPQNEFWSVAVSAVKAKRPDFIFLAEVYWDLESKLQELGFDYTYDKRLLDRLKEGEAGSIRGHLRAAPDFQAKSARMIENHDELRAADVFPGHQLRAAAVLTYAAPGMLFFHEGQLEGRRVKVPVQLRRRIHETPDLDAAEFYEKLLNALSEEVMNQGSWKLLECHPAWDGNFSHHRMFCFFWRHGAQSRLAAVNYAPDASQTYVIPPFLPDGAAIRFKDLMSDRFYDRNAEDLRARGLYLDMPGWDFHLFALDPLKT